MKQKSIHSLIIMFFSTFTASSVSFCKSSQTQAYYDYLIGEFELAQGNVNKAAVKFKDLSKRGLSQKADISLIRMLAKGGNYVEIAKIPNNLPLENLELQLIFVQAYLASGQPDKALELAARLKKKHPSNELIAYYTAMIQMQRKDFYGALNTISEFLSKFSLGIKASMFHFLKAKVYLQLQDLSKSLEALEKSIELNPRLEEAYLLKALMLESTNKKEEAIKNFKSYLNLVDNQPVLQKLVILLYEQGRLKEAREQIEKIKEKDAQYFVNLSLIDFGLEKLESADQSSKKALELDPSFKKAQLLRVNILFSQGKTKEMLEFFFDWFAKEPQDKEALGAFEEIVNRLSDDQVLGVLVENYNKGVYQKVLAAAISDLYIKSEQYIKALPYLTKVLELSVDEKLKSKVLYRLSYCKYRSGDNQDIEESLLTSIRFDSKYSPPYNFLAYYYANKGIKLKAALDLVNKALFLEPQNFGYLDTKGLVLLKSGNKAEARQAFEKALQGDPGNEEIRKHLELVN